MMCAYKDRAFQTVTEFAAMRRKLIDVLAEQEGPWRTGDTLMLHGKLWTLRRHGGGVMFHDDASGLCVDVCELERVESFEVWELATYLGSMRHTGSKLVHKALGYSASSLDGATAIMCMMCVRGLATCVDEGRRYRV